MIYVLYSGDYEVFMGGNYRPESEVLLEPTRLALDTFESIGAPLTLFADLLCLWRYRELGLGEFPDQVDGQLREVVQRGHDVQMHIHPHWPQTRIERRGDGSTHYHYDSASIYPGPHIPDLYDFTLRHLRAGKEYLTCLLRDATPDYQCIAYRAGAYGILPGTQEILAAIEDAGYLIDSSVVPGFPGLDVPTSPIDFRFAPRRGNYWLSRKWGLAHPADTGVFEIPIAAAVVHEIGPLLRLKLKAIRRRLNRGPAPHAHLGYTAAEGLQHAGAVKRRPWWSRITRNIVRSLSWRHWGMLDIVDAPKVMMDITRCYVQQYRRESTDLFFSVSFHPKDFVARKRAALREYHEWLKRHYGDGIRAITFREAAGLIPPSRGEDRAPRTASNGTATVDV